MDECNQSSRPAHVRSGLLARRFLSPQPTKLSTAFNRCSTYPYHRYLSPPSMPPKPDSKSPPRWPPHLTYLPEPRYHSSVSKEVHAIVCPSHTERAQPPLAPQKHPVAIQFISDPSHPAHGQFGLFATKKIPPRTLVLDYVGEIHCDDRPDSDYDLSLHRTVDHVSVGVDAQHAGNEARFINDFRSVKSKPNAFFQERRTERGELRMSVWTGSEAIKKGEALLVSYGKYWWRARGITGDEGLDCRETRESSE